MGRETPFEDNDLTTDYNGTREHRSCRKKPEIRLWGNLRLDKGSKKRLEELDIGWAENIKTNILVINALNDKVVSPDKIIEMQ